MKEALLDVPVLVVDCQSTGSTPVQGHLLEAGWASFTARLGDLDVEDVSSRVVALPDGARVPRVVAELTGLSTEEALAAGVPIERVYRELSYVLADLGGFNVPTVIHFAQFEARFLRDLTDRFGEGEFPFDLVCTHTIARRLLPDLPRRSLRALAGYFGFSSPQLRRAAEHVAATCFVWSHLVHALAEQGVATWPDLQIWLASKPKRTGARARAYPMPREKRLGLPAQPGVYRFLRTNGDLLYVGKATSLKHRVNSHFRKQAKLTERTLELLSQARDLDFTVTATALEAAVLESDEIKTRAPPYNVALLESGREVWFATSDLSRTSAKPDEAHRVGPVPSAFSFSSVASLCALFGRSEAADPSVYLAARTLGIMPTSAPDAEVFLQGFERFRQVHFAGAQTSPSLAESLALARRLFARALDAPPKKRRKEESVVWDSERVMEHLEDALTRIPQLLRRAVWLCHLTDASVAFREPDAAGKTRLLIVEGTELVERGHLASGAELPVPAHAARTLAERRALFDIVRYDRLRVLTTELKRICRDGGEVRVRFSAGATLMGPALVRALRPC